MDTKLLEKLEFNKILDMVSTYCSTYLGRALCFDTKISSNEEEISIRLKKVTQIQELILKIGNLPLTEIPNIENSIKKIELDGILSFKELLEIAHVLKISRETKEYISNARNLDKSAYPHILIYFDKIYCNPRIEHLILDNILDEENISDNASKELYEIRKKIKGIENKIHDTLNNFILSPTYQKYLQDNVITIKNNRSVILVKQEYRSQIKGLVHDTSSSGSTLFIEPNNVIEYNNQIRELKNVEEIEIEKIIYSYCAELQKILEQISNNLRIIGILDFLSAKAKYGLNNSMFEPLINTNKYINLINAKHPLIDKNVVVPISLEITNKYNCMIITGPNTGGKTVTLKTVGLLTLMTQYGLHIPASEGSSIAIFDNIYTDIGDEQSIEQNLSTFSSHLTNIVNITNKVNSNSIVLIDELGSGTDPIEGSALAIGVLEYLNKINCLTLCTTHYSELKTYALSNDNILNACMEFDLKTLKPTFKLILGIPGKSNAFVISEKLGLKKEILENASQHITSNISNFEDILLKIEKEKKEIEKIKRNTQSEYSKVQINSKYLLEEKEKIINTKEEIINKAKQDARQLLLDSKEEINQIISDIYNQKTAKDIQTYKTKINENINKKITSLNNNVAKENISNTNISDLKIGQEVYISKYDKYGNILDIIDNNTVLMQIGVIKTNININEISIICSNDKKINKDIKINIENKSRQISSSINVLGKTVDEAIYEIDKYLDDAYIAKLAIVTIIHGKGTGKLQKGIHGYLKSNQYIKSYRLGSYSEGQNGVTIIEMKY